MTSDLDTNTCENCGANFRRKPGETADVWRQRRGCGKQRCSRALSGRPVRGLAAVYQHPKLHPILARFLRAAA